MTKQEALKCAIEELEEAGEGTGNFYRGEQAHIDKVWEAHRILCTLLNKPVFLENLKEKTINKNLTVTLALHNYEIIRMSGPDNVKIILRDYEIYEKGGFEHGINKDDGCTDFKKDEDGDYYIETEV